MTGNARTRTLVILLAVAALAVGYLVASNDGRGDAGAQNTSAQVAETPTQGAHEADEVETAQAETAQSEGNTSSQATDSGDGDASGVSGIASEVSPSVVQINVSSTETTPFGEQESEGIGSGVVYREDGYIVTNNHVVEGVTEVNVLFADGSTETGQVVGNDSFADLAVVKVERTGLPAASFGDSSDIQVGETAVAIGSPSGFQSTVTEGIVSGLGREVSSEYTGGSQDSSLVDLIQTDAAISPGSSGGALLNDSGEVIGINVAYLPSDTGAESIGFAIPSNTTVDVADQLIEDGEAEHPYLGVGLADLTPEIAEQYGIEAESGALISDVEEGGPASDAGVQNEDVVTAINGEVVETSGDLLSALRDYAPGETVTLTLVRDGGETQASVALGQREETDTEETQSEEQYALPEGLVP